MNKTTVLLALATATVMIAAVVITNAVTLEVGPYDVTVGAEDIPRVKAHLNSRHDRQVVVETNVTVEVVDPPVSTNDWLLQEDMLGDNLSLSNGWVVAETNTQYIKGDDPLMDLTGDETPQEENQKLEVKMEWLVGLAVKARLNADEMEVLTKERTAVVLKELAATNNVYEVEVTP